MKINKETKINRDYVLREIAGESMLIPTGAAALSVNGMITLNPTACCIWKQLAAGEGEEEILATLMQEFQVEEGEARKDLEEILEMMREKGMVE